MDNILSYIHLRQDIFFAERAFNAADALILSALAYADWSDVSQEEETPLPLACLKYLSQNAKEIQPKEDSISSFVPTLIRALRNAKRFQEVKLKNYHEKKSKEECLQFAAVTFELPDKSLVIAFRGTDGSMTGWHENMKMLYMDDLPCQRLARQYLEDMAEQSAVENKGWSFFRKMEHPGIYLTGHSKGGNLAMYAALCNPELEARIVQVFNFDGPGFRDSFYQNKSIGSILKKITTILPRGSVIGRLFSHKETSIIVNSGNEGMIQHNAFHWHVAPTGFLPAKEFDPESDDAQAYIEQFVLSKSDAENKALTDCLFSLLGQLEVETITDLENLKIQQGIEGFMVMNTLSAEEKDFIWIVIQLLSGHTSPRKTKEKNLLFRGGKSV